MRTRCGPLTAFAATFAVLTSTSSVRLEIQRQPVTVMPLPDTMFGASADAGSPGEPGNEPKARATITKPRDARRADADA